MRAAQSGQRQLSTGEARGAAGIIAANGDVPQSRWRVLHRINTALGNNVDTGG